MSSQALQDDISEPSFSDFPGSDLTLSDYDSPTPLNKEFTTPTIREPLSRNTTSTMSDINHNLSMEGTNGIDHRAFLFDDALDIFSDTTSSTEMVSDWVSEKESLASHLDIEVKSPVPKRTIINGESKSSNAQISTEQDMASVSSLTPLTSEDELPKVMKKSSRSPTQPFNKSSVPASSCPVPNKPGRRLNLKSALDLSNPNIQDRAGRCQLFRYAQEGDVATCRKLLQANADVNLSDHAGWRPIHIACYYAHPRIVKLFLDYKADIHARGLLGHTPLHEAAQSGNREVIRILLDSGADLYSRNDEGCSPVDLCTKSDCVALMDKRLEASKGVNFKDSLGRSKLHYACQGKDLAEVVKLVEAGADVNLQDKRLISPLHLAVENGTLDTVTYLINRGAMVNLKDDGDNVPLHYACRGEKIPIVRLLLQTKGIIPLGQNSNGLTPIDFSTETIAGMIRDQVIAESTTAMIMDRLLPRSKPFGESLPLNKNRNTLPYHKTKPRSIKNGKVSMSNGNPVPASLSTNTPSPSAETTQSRPFPECLGKAEFDRVKPNKLIKLAQTNGTKLQVNGVLSLSEEAKLELRGFYGYNPICLVYLKEEKGHSLYALDYQLQLALSLPTHSNSLVTKYPKLPVRPVLEWQKGKFRCMVERLISDNSTRDSVQKAQKFLRDFNKRRLNFVHWKSFIKVFEKDYPMYSTIHDTCMYDIYYDETAYDKLCEYGLPGDQGFKPARITYLDKDTPIPPPLLSFPKPSIEFDYIGTPYALEQIGDFLTLNPDKNPRPDLPIPEAVKHFILDCSSSFKHSSQR